MQPIIDNYYHHSGGITEFRLSGVDVSVANALRRTILTDIRRIVLSPTQVEINTSAHFHNEIMKHRIQCVPMIPKHHGQWMTDEEIQDFIQNHVILIDIQNESSDILYVTTEHFKIIHRSTEQVLTTPETEEKFPPYANTRYFIDLMRLSPTRGVHYPGEHFKAVINLSWASAKVDGCFSVVSICSFQNTLDTTKAEQVWVQHSEQERKQLEESGQEAIDEILNFQKRDFDLLDAQRYYLENSFDFMVESNGIYENNDIVYRACHILMEKSKFMMQQIDQEEIKSVDSRSRVHHGGNEFSTMPNCMDILLPDGDYTMGYLLNHLMYTMFFEGEQKLSYCGYTKYHPHLSESVLRLAFQEENEMVMWPGMIKKALTKVSDMFESIQTKFARKTSVKLK